MPDPRVILAGERNAIDLLAARFPTDKPVVFDVGANVGDYTLELLARVPQAKVYCFEPQPDAVSDLIDRAEELGWEITIVPWALSSTHEKLSFRATKTHCCYLAGQYRSFDEPSGLPLDRFFEVRGVTLDYYCSVNWIQRIDWLKLDVEGHEPWVLMGAKHMLKSHSIDVIQFEMSDVAAMAGWTFNDMWVVLRGYGFQVYLELDDGLELIDSPTDRFENPIHYVNMLAISDTCRWWS